MGMLRVRVYNVRFGDAILISVPDHDPDGGTITRNILIDFGNAPSGLGEGGSDAVFRPVIEDILKVLAGRPLDLYVMTHEHLDHVQGLPYAVKKLGQQVKANFAWLTASAAPNYYETHPKAKEKRSMFQQAYAEIEHFFAASPESIGDASQRTLFQNLLLNNNPQSTSDCVSFLRDLTGNPARNAYVYRDCNLSGKHPFREARFGIWAPEEDTSAYYHSLLPMALDVMPGEGAEAKSTLTVPIPPSGVDAGAFYALVEMRRQGHTDNLLAIDRAANNTSVVFLLEWRGWKLLFTGDAEQASWRIMDRYGKLEPVHFLKVAHHGSWNGTPPLELLEKVLPKVKPDARKRYAAVSTCEDTYSGVPDQDTLDQIMSRCELKSTHKDLDAQPNKLYLDFECEG